MLASVGLVAAGPAVGDPGSTDIAPAVCGPGSSPENGVQGQVPRADRDNGRSTSGYRCNLGLVGQYQGQGAGFISASYGTCVYFGTFFPASNLTLHPGVQVIDVADPAHPRFVRSLLSPAFASGTWESLKVDPVRGHLAAVGVQAPPGFGGLFFDIYDIKGDCTRPRLLNGVAGTSLTLPTAVLGHEAGFSPDGNTYYATDGIGHLTALDVSVPSSPRVIAFTAVGLTNHGFSISPDGRTLYGTTLVPGGVQALDIGDIQDRRPLPQVRHIGQATWSGGIFTQHTINFTANGRRYLFAIDEGGTGGIHLLDNENAAQPSVIRDYELQIQQAGMAATRSIDTGGNGLLGYTAHYCTIDRPVDPTMLACAYWQSGIRLYDIRDLLLPREIGYYNPPARTGLLNRLRLTNSPHMYFVYSPTLLSPADLTLGGVLLSATPDTTTDWCSSPPRFVGTNQLWVTCEDNGFLALSYPPLS